MKSISIHISAILRVFKMIYKFDYILFFIPSVVISLLFYFLFSFSYKVDLATSTFQQVINTISEQSYLFFVLTILSPFYTRLSQKLDTQLTNQKYSSGIIEFFRDFVRMIFIVLFSIIIEFLLMGTWWLLSYLGGFQFLNSTVFFIISAFFIGFSFYDYSLERHEIGIFSSFSFASKMPLNLILTGSIFLFISMIPLLGIILAPIISTMIATIVYLYSTKKIS